MNILAIHITVWFLSMLGVVYLMGLFYADSLDYSPRDVLVETMDVVIHNPLRLLVTFMMAVASGFLTSTLFAL